MTDGLARLKHRWVQWIMHNAELSPRARVVGYEIGRRLNSVSGTAWPSQETLRQTLGFSAISQIKRAIAELKSSGCLAVQVDAGRRNNIYTPRFEILRLAPPLTGASVDRQSADAPATPRVDRSANGTCSEHSCGFDGSGDAPLSSSNNHINDP